ncbi:MAG: T9SS type A sorting domain-containing protein [Bacteroidetes bacterium]|nr:T9SS type A sorting domain-containing protein [Bacteroidota bacterium]
MKKLVLGFASFLLAFSVFAQTTENFETGTKTGYATGTVTLTSGDWIFTNSLLGTSASDRKNGIQSVRMRTGAGNVTEMSFNVSNAGDVTVYHAKYGSDANSTWKLQQSTDNGSNWTDVGSVQTASSTTLSAVTFTVNSNVPIRFRFAGADAAGGTLRVNLDDVTITAFGADNPPSISNLGRSSNIPDASSNLTITATISDDNDTPTATVYYRINGGSYNSVNMTNTSGFNYSGIIPGSALSNGDFLEYYVEAQDVVPQTTTSATQKVFVGTTPVSSIRINDGLGQNVYNNVLAKITGVASYANGILGGANMDWYLEDATGGLNIFKFGDNTFTTTIGNSYTVTGTITAFNGRVEIVPSSTSDIIDNGIVGINYSLVPFASFIADPEAYEGELVGFKNVIIKSGTWPSSTTFVTLGIKDNSSSTDTTVLNINNITAGTQPEGAFDIIGVVRQNDNTSPYTGGYLITPRSTDDFAPANTLPVELSSFTVSASGKSALLKWETTTEKSNAGFEVLKSSDKKTWNSMAFINGKGTTTEKQVYSYSDKNVTGTVYYRLKQVDTDGTATLSEILSFNGTPAAFEVSGNYPNPFNPATTIRFTLPVASPVVVKVHNIIGQQIATLVNGKLEAGLQEIPFDASGLASGVYFYSVSANGKTITKSMTLMK